MYTTCNQYIYNKRKCFEIIFFNVTPFFRKQTGWANPLGFHCFLLGFTKSHLDFSLGPSHTHYPTICVPLSKPGGGDQVVSVAGVGGERYAMTAQQLLNGMTPSRRAKIPIWCKVCVRSFLGQRLSTAWFVGIHDKSDLHKANAKTAGVAITDYPDAPPDLTEQVPCTGILVTDGTRAWHSMA